jgi:hypothetical protein
MTAAGGIIPLSARKSSGPALIARVLVAVEATMT